MNQAEVIHAGWAHRDLPNLSLLDACHADVRNLLQIEVDLKNFENGAGPGGARPSYMERKNKQHNQQIQRAKLANEAEGMRISPNSKHRPPPKQQKKQSKKSTVSQTPSNGPSVNAIVVNGSVQPNINVMQNPSSQLYVQRPFKWPAIATI